MNWKNDAVQKKFDAHQKKNDAEEKKFDAHHFFFLPHEMIKRCASF
ncbi:hypothetical protein ACT29H_00440 [Thermophagus sp. OGC60D27]